jgi:hypothetical protein
LRISSHTLTLTQAYDTFTGTITSTTAARPLARPRSARAAATAGIAYLWLVGGASLVAQWTGRTDPPAAWLTAQALLAIPVIALSVCGAGRRGGTWRLAFWSPPGWLPAQ